MIRISVAALGVAASLLVVFPAAAAGVVLDQASIPGAGHFDFVGGSSIQLGTGGVAQTFTVGVDGALDHVAVAVEHWTFLGATGDIRFELQDASFTTLLTRDIAAADIPDFSFGGFDWENTLQIDVRSAGIAVLAGQQFALKVSSLGGYGGATWRQGYSGASINYAAGAAYSYDGPPGFPLPILLGGDVGFRTFVDTGSPPPMPVPEPAAWALMIMGFTGVGAGLRRRRALAEA